jgi:peptidyl-prolyl cis-trans isomerase B (cyclophilin B)
MMLRTPVTRYPLALLLAGLFAVGCGQKSQPEPVASETPAASQKTAASTPAARPEPAALPAEQASKLNQSFAAAVRTADNPPSEEDSIRPPDRTAAGKPVHQILDQVQKLWPTIALVDADNKPIDYTAIIETDLGTIQIALFPTQAPNHVRNFIALAKAGYYDQLFFDRIRHDNNDQGNELHCIEAGCPLGNGSTGPPGSIGYWLKEEFTKPETMIHDVGIVGACRGAANDSAATRFYVMLNKAPFLDGHCTIFGKVVAGLDIVRRIAEIPVISDEEGNTRPEKAVRIHRVTIQQNERGKSNIQ